MIAERWRCARFPLAPVQQCASSPVASLGKKGSGRAAASSHVAEEWGLGVCAGPGCRVAAEGHARRSGHLEASAGDPSAQRFASLCGWRRLPQLKRIWLRPEGGCCGRPLRHSSDPAWQVPADPRGYLQSLSESRWCGDQGAEPLLAIELASASAIRVQDVRHIALPLGLTAAGSIAAVNLRQLHKLHRDLLLPQAPHEDVILAGLSIWEGLQLPGGLCEDVREAVPVDHGLHPLRPHVRIVLWVHEAECHCGHVDHVPL
mmetsp:Transcript_81371/g.239001  ORF Transcript_81371/g.239001 Transcript_81371/m.239001 type:complete len:260 (-) Transcript_81371:1398-2177(-)